MIKNKMINPLQTLLNNERKTILRFQQEIIDSNSLEQIKHLQILQNDAIIRIEKIKHKIEQIQKAQTESQLFPIQKSMNKTVSVI